MPLSIEKTSKKKAKNSLAGATEIAIETARRNGTSLIVRDAKGNFQEISPKKLSSRLSKANNSKR